MSRTPHVPDVDVTARVRLLPGADIRIQRPRDGERYFSIAFGPCAAHLILEREELQSLAIAALHALDDQAAADKAKEAARCRDIGTAPAGRTT